MSFCERYRNDKQAPRFLSCASRLLIWGSHDLAQVSGNGVCNRHSETDEKQESLSIDLRSMTPQYPSRRDGLRNSWRMKLDLSQNVGSVGPSPDRISPTSGVWQSWLIHDDCGVSSRRGLSEFVSNGGVFPSREMSHGISGLPHDGKFYITCRDHQNYSDHDGIDRGGAFACSGSIVSASGSIVTERDNAVNDSYERKEE